MKTFRLTCGPLRCSIAILTTVGHTVSTKYGALGIVHIKVHIPKTEKE